MTRAFRICMTRHAETAFSGAGAKQYGGRWNSPGSAVVYTSASLSLAMLEVWVHLEEPEVLATGFSWIEAAIPDDLIEFCEPSLLPRGWADGEVTSAAQTYGDAWLREANSAVLALPSAVVPIEWNFLINPTHPDFGKIVLAPARSFRPDQRLFRPA